MGIISDLLTRDKPVLDERVTFFDDVEPDQPIDEDGDDRLVEDYRVAEDG